MNDENIKEILDNFEKYEARYKLHNETQFIITHREIQILLDSITNLKKKLDRRYYKNEYERIKEENERLKDELKYTIPDVQHNQIVTKLAKEKNDYKSRCEKASEYLKECYSQPENIENFMTESEMNYLLNILQNGDVKNGN